MAEPRYLEKGEVPLASIKYLASTAHVEAAHVALQLFKKYEFLEVRDIQIPRDKKYTCWYTYLNHSESPRILNLGLFPSGAVDVEFRYVPLLPPKMRDGLRRQTGNWLCARIAPSKFAYEAVLRMLDQYLPRVSKANEAGQLKQGGTSFAETVLSELLSLETKRRFVKGERPEWLRNPQGNLVQLDFYLPDFRIAIEVQGAQHFKDVYKSTAQFDRLRENDDYKVRACLENNISMVWVHASGLQDKFFMKLNSTEQLEKIDSFLSLAQKSHPSHVIWTDVNTLPVLVPRSA
jgi:hypothetical protein